MHYKRLRLAAIILLILAFIMPAIATVLISIQGRPEDRQYDGLQFIIMAVYNLPFIIVSFVALISGVIFNARLKLKAAQIAQVISIISSFASCLLMLWWALA